MSNLAYFSADTLGVTLYSLDGGLKANEIRQLLFGPWRVDLTVDVVSDMVNAKEFTFWVTLAKKLPLYVIVREKECWLAVLDPALLKTCGASTGFKGETVKERIVEIKPAMKGVFHWTNERWVQVLTTNPTGS